MSVRVFKRFATYVRKVSTICSSTHLFKTAAGCQLVHVQRFPLVLCRPDEMRPSGIAEKWTKILWIYSGWKWSRYCLHVYVQPR